MLVLQALTHADDTGMVDFKEATMPRKSVESKNPGKARAEALSPEERSEIARHAAAKKWDSDEGLAPEVAVLPKATHAGDLKIGDAVIPCAVLSTGQRVLSEHGIANAILGGRSGASKRLKRSGPPMPLFMAPTSLKPFIPSELESGPPVIVYRQGRRVLVGFDATILPKVCNVWLKAREAGALQAQQLGKAMQAEILMRGLAEVGIIALVDEATGYQDDRARDELQKILSKYIRVELLSWTRRFPDEFFKQVYRIHGWKYQPGVTQGPRYVGKLIKKYIYGQLPPGVLSELEKKNPPVDGRRKFKHFQWLTKDTGHPHLDGQILRVTTLLQVSDNPKDFERHFNKAFPAAGQQTEMPLEDEE